MHYYIHSEVHVAIRMVTQQHLAIVCAHTQY